MNVQKISQIFILPPVLFILSGLPCQAATAPTPTVESVATATGGVNSVPGPALGIGHAIGHPSVNTSSVKRPAVEEKTFVALEIPRSSPGLDKFPALKNGKGGWFAHLLQSSTVDLDIPVSSSEYAGLPMAMVDGTPITMGEFNKEMHLAKGQEDKFLFKGKPSKLLDRLITVRLFAREGKAIGFEKLPEMQASIDAYSRKVLRKLLGKELFKGVTADPKLVQKLYKEAVTQYKLQGVSIHKKKDAEDFLKKLKSGEDFKDAAKKYIGAKKATGSAVAQWVMKKELLPEIVKALVKMKDGEISPILPIHKEYTILKRNGYRSPEKDPAALKMAREEALNYAENMIEVKYNKQLTKKYVTIDKALLKSVDFDKSVKDFIKLLKDKRVVATIKADPPVTITVGDIATKTKEHFYHGIERQIKEKKANKQKYLRLNEILFKDLFVREAKARGLDHSPEYLRMMGDFKEAALFNAFLEKVLLPDVKLNRKEVDAYYRQHTDEFTSPRMLTVDRLVFADRGKAEKTVEDLRQGTDFQWLKNNTDGLINNQSGLLDFGHLPVIDNSLPAPVRKVLADAKAGDCRLYDDQQGHYYVLYVQQLIPPKTQPLKEVQKDVAKLLFRKKFNVTLQKWSRKLRKAYAVEVYAQRFHH